MRFLVDENTGVFVAQWLRQQGHEVFSVYEEACGTDDDEILRKAVAESWILITSDKDFGEKIFRDRGSPCGVILLRLADERSPNKIATLQRLLNGYAAQLANNFVVATEQKVRFAYQ
ncbi:MAG: DUF5615 family PIN-like protein [Leptolyngbyaceae cyanobacterium]